ncbi:hypothetical protein D1BOALGB6SA_10852 [Olavius sp. associated proteobacterium Delta 1]|nr:hypothetical protein D1BOALGB6SA_10852 [Olavius sp. associated proteobacterium Delta 1]
MSQRGIIHIQRAKVCTERIVCLHDKGDNLARFDLQGLSHRCRVTSPISCDEIEIVDQIESCLFGYIQRKIKAVGIRGLE